MIFNILALPEELQIWILEYCRMDTLFNLCITNKQIYHMAHRVLWKSLDFVSPFIDVCPACGRAHGSKWRPYAQDSVEVQRRFFAQCENLRQEEPERWSKLASLPISLEVSRVPGINVVHESTVGRQNDFVFIDESSTGTSIYDIIAEFHNLEALSLFVKDHWNPGPEESCESISRNLVNLKKLKIGGQVSIEMLRALLSRPEQITALSLINLIKTPGQGMVPDGILFLRPLRARFTSLKGLHLSKLASLHDENHKRIHGDLSFDRDREGKILREWGTLLRNVSQTLEELTLENCYHLNSSSRGRKSKLRAFLESLKLGESAGHGPRTDDGDEDIDTASDESAEGESEDDQTDDEGANDNDTTDPANTHYGLKASLRCGRVLGPAINESTWPRLRLLMIKGMPTLHISNNVIPCNSIRYLPGSIATWNYDATPLSTSPPPAMYERGQ